MNYFKNIKKINLDRKRKIIFFNAAISQITLNNSSTGTH